MSAAGVVLLAFAGLGTGLSLIIAIGAQNAYVLRQGLRREHVGVVVAICALSDAILILAGVSGIGVIVERAPWLITVIRWAERHSSSRTASWQHVEQCAPTGSPQTPAAS